MGSFVSVTKGCFWPRLCKNVFQRDRYSKTDCKSRFYEKSTSAHVPINFRFNVDTHTSILAKRFYTPWVDCCPSRRAEYDPKLPFVTGRNRPMAVSPER